MPFVEDAVARAFALPPLANIAALAVLGGAAFAPRIALASAGDGAGAPLAAHALGALAATALGAFPVAGPGAHGGRGMALNVRA